MSTQKSHIFKQFVLLVCLSLNIYTYAQIKATVNDITTLSVSELDLNANYAWEIYDHIPSDFATTKDNISDKAIFVGGNDKPSVKVKWLEAGVYYYKIIINNTCTNNLKIGKAIIKPQKPRIDVVFNCQEGTTILKSDASGDLKWSTGETASQIVLTKAGSFSLTQTINGMESTPTEVTISDPEKLTRPDVSGVPTTIFLDQEVDLSVVSCEKGEIHWYSDDNLTNPVLEPKFNVNHPASYYAVCQYGDGCISEVSELKLIVYYEDDCKKDYMGLQSKIYNLINTEHESFDLGELKDYCQKCNKKIDLEIFNRWGNTVFKQDDYLNSDNKFRGFTYGARAVVDPNRKLPSGTYFYIIHINGEEPLKGWLYIKN